VQGAIHLLSHGVTQSSFRTLLCLLSRSLAGSTFHTHHDRLQYPVRSTPTDDTVDVLTIGCRIRCAGCEKNLLPNRFSETSQKKYRESKSARQRNPKVQVKPIQCLNCTSTSRTEMKCVMCDQVMGLERFSKAQRRKTDDAVSTTETSKCLHLTNL